MYPNFEYYALFDGGYSKRNGALAHLIKDKLLNLF